MPCCPVLKIIETDGVATQPLVVDELEMLAGQRYSVVVSLRGSSYLNQLLG